MMFPSVFGENLFDDWMNDFGFNDNLFSSKNPLYGKHAKNIMKTDVRETDKGYELDVDLPGFKKDEVQVQLKDGYLTISAAKGLDKDEQDKKGNYIRRERYAGSSSRSFYVGNGLKNEDVHAKFENGVLRLSLPKKAAEEIEADKYISFTGGGESTVIPFLLFLYSGQANNFLLLIAYLLTLLNIVKRFIISGIF